MTKQSKIVIPQMAFDEGDKVVYLTPNGGMYIGIICGFKYMRHPYRTKMMWGIMSENNYNDRENNEYKIDWVTTDNITLYNEKILKANE